MILEPETLKHLGPFMPVGHSLCLTEGRLSVYDHKPDADVNGQQFMWRKWKFTTPPLELRSGIGCLPFSGESREALEQVHGDGILMALHNEKTQINGFIGFWNPTLNNFSGGGMTKTWYVKNTLKEYRKTSATITKKGLLGTRTVPYEHNEDSLIRFYSDLLDFCEEQRIFQEMWEEYRRKRNTSELSNRMHGGPDGRL